MRPEEWRYPREWLRLAERDLSRVSRCLRDHDTGAAGFFLQQALEKFLKAFLLARGWKLRRIHDLEALLDDALAHDPSLERFRPLCQEVTGYYLAERYPLPGVSGPDEAQVQSALAAAEPLVRRLRAAIET